MRALSLFRAELLLHQRSLRTRLVLLIYPLLTLAPWPLLMGALGSDLLVGPATALSVVAFIQPYSALLLAAGLAGRGADRASREELLPLLAGSPFSNTLVIAARAAVLAVLYLGATALPYLALAAGGFAGPPPDLLALAGSWLFSAWPMAVTMGWTWLALALIGGSDLAALLLLWLGGALLGQVARRLGDWQTSLGWPFFESPNSFREFVGLALRGASGISDNWWLLVRLVASEGAYDPLLALERVAVDFLPPLAFAVLLLALATLRLGRCQADLSPRNFAWAPSLGRLRQALALDGGLGHQRWTPWLALAPLLLALFLVERKADAFVAGGEARYQAEKQDLGGPTDPALTLLSMRVEADLGSSAHLPDGQLESRFEERFEHRGPAPLGQLAFGLNPGLEIVKLTAEAGGAPLELTTRRRHNRLWLELEPPLQPGATLALSGQLAGRPATPYFLLRPSPADNFAESWEMLQRDRDERRRIRFAATHLHPAISRNQVRLAAEDLLPLPRYTAWQGYAAAQQATSSERAQSDSTPGESSLALARIDLELKAPAAWRLFSACGHASEEAGGRGLLRGGCEMRPAEFAVRGGLLTVQERGEVAVATTPGHAEAVLPLLDSLEQIHRQSENAWPGAPRLGKVVLLESLKFFEPNLPQLGFSETQNFLHSRGSLLEIDERQMIALKSFDPLELAGPLLVDRLLRRRALDRNDEWAIAILLREVVTRRLGLRPQTAVLGGAPWLRGTYSRPLAGYRNFESQLGGRRIAALMADLEGRVGGNAVQLGIQDFLAGGEGGGPGGIKDLIAAIEKRSETSLALFYADFIDQGGLPELELAEVKVENRPGGLFAVAGQLKNTGSGEVLCPIVVRTDRGEQWQKVRVGGGAASSFVFETAQKPVVIELDPAATCLRFVASGMAAGDRVAL